MLPFTRAEFFQTFAEYNSAIWPVQVGVAAWGVALAVLLLAPVGRTWATRIVAGSMALFWIFQGVVYHWLFFTGINPAASVFGALFVIAGAVFAWEGLVTGRLRLCVAHGARRWGAALLIGYSVVVYPALALVLHPYPQTPLFGVAPCPTTIFTLGVLLTARHPVPLGIAAIPLLWALVGTSAAWLLDVPADLGLAVAAAVWVFARYEFVSGHGTNYSR
jgi:hypothetical protein